MKTKAKKGDKFGDLTITRVMGRGQFGLDTLLEVECKCGVIFNTNMKLLNGKHKLWCGLCNTKVKCQMGDLCKECREKMEENRRENYAR